MNVHYQRANVNQIQWAIEEFSWEKSFRNLNINEVVSFINKTIKNILSNYIAHETIICDNKDPPQTVNSRGKRSRSYILADKNPKILGGVKSLQNQLKCLKVH